MKSRLRGLYGRSGRGDFNTPQPEPAAATAAAVPLIVSALPSSLLGIAHEKLAEKCSPLAMADSIKHLCQLAVEPYGHDAGIH